jgi:hypothetical protein
MEMSGSKASPGHEGVKMSETDKFRQYAEEALRRAVQSKNEKEQWALIELARTWTQAATASERTMVVNYSPTDHQTAW